MKVLISGCSFSSGWGFDQGVDSDKIWPNLLAQDLGWNVDNVSVTGIDNVGIFINTVKNLDKAYDLILVQWTNLTRTVMGIHPGDHHVVGEFNMVPNIVDDQEYRIFHKVFTVINGGIWHWQRFRDMCLILQRDQRVVFINGLLGWDSTLMDTKMSWTQHQKSPFFNQLIDAEFHDDNTIENWWKKLQTQFQDIDISRWINPWEDFNSIKCDNISQTDPHPGIKSQVKFADIIKQSKLITP